MATLNVEPELFAAYRPPQDEQSEHVEYFGGGHLPGHLKQGSLHGGGGRHHHGGRSFRWGLYRDQFGSGGSTQDPQSIWARRCLAQLTGGGMSLHGRGARRAIRIFQRQNQLAPTGRLDEDTIAALQEACGDQRDSDGTSDMQGGEGEVSSPWSLPPAPSPVQRQVAPTVPTAPARDAWELWFEWNSTRLRQDNEVDSVVQLAAVIKQAFSHLQAAARAGKIVLKGFSSQEGTEARNRALSLQRAQRVKDLLVDAGVSEDRIQVVGNGPSNIWPGGLKWNRRVEIDFQP